MSPSRTRSKRAPKAKRARGSVASLWHDFAASGIEVRYRPVSKADIAKAEKALGGKVPASYVELVTTVGAPAVVNRWLPPRTNRNDPWNMICAVLRPAEIVKLTRSLRKGWSPEYFDDEETLPRLRRQWANAIYFQNDTDPNNGYVFLLNTATAKREAKVGEYVHDYVEEIDWDNGDTVVASMYESTKLALARARKTVAAYVANASE